MGEALYEGLRERDAQDVPCRVYAPVGSHQDLLPYLVRRLLENGANTSFVNRILDDSVPIESLVEDPVVRLARIEPKRQSADPSAAGALWREPQQLDGSRPDRPRGARPAGRADQRGPRRRIGGRAPDAARAASACCATRPI